MFIVENVLKQVYALSQFVFFNFPLEYTIMQVQANQGGFKLNGTIIIWFMVMTLIYWVKAYKL
jgi:hypothetical protein